MALSQILAGPIIRRVQADSASIWVAFSQAQTVSLYIWEDTVLKKVPQNHTGVFKPKEADPVLKQENVSTKPFGAKLHIALVTVKGDFKAEKIYSYNLVFKTNGQEQDLHTCGFLKDCGGKRAGLTENVPLGFEERQLPSFILPNSKLEDLVISHGSCRRLHAKGNDALALLDDVIKENISVFKKRPQQLFMTGDQLYADEQPYEVLYFLNKTAIELAGKAETLKLHLITELPKEWEDSYDEYDLDVVREQFNDNPLNPSSAPCDLQHFPLGFRGTIVNLGAGYTTTSGENHLLSFAEFCAGYLYTWSAQSWDDELLSDLIQLAKEPLVTDFEYEKLTNKDNAPFVYSKITKQILDTYNNHNIEMGRLIVLNDRARYIKRTSMYDEDARRKWEPEFTKGIQTEARRVYEFLRTLPYVSRVLANIPVYMIFDDHDVTDDWNFNLRWCNRVYTTPLGVDISRNALMAYAVFQDWGNSPAAYNEEKSTKQQVLDTISKASQEISSSQRANDETNETLNSVFGFGVRDPENPDPKKLEDQRIRWHFRLKTGPADTFFLDTRTRRHFAHLNAFPILIPEKALDEQLPDPDPAKLPPMTFVISAVPLQSPSILEEQGQPIISGVEVLSNGNSIAGEAKGIVSTRLQRDLEAWGFNPAGHDLLLKKLAKFKQVAVLSGDVHYGFSIVTDYWDKNNTTQPARIMQLTSSSLKNPWGPELRIFMSGFTERLLSGFEGKIEKQVWRDNAEELEVSGEVPARSRARLHKVPVILAGHGWPEGSTITPAPEAKWRMVIKADERELPGDELKVPKSLNSTEKLDLIREQPNFPDPPVPQGIEIFPEATTPHENLEVYKAMATRHQNRLAKGLARRLIWHTNVAVIDFAKTNNDKYILHHRFRYRLRTGDKPPIPAEAAPLDDRSEMHTEFFTEHHIPLKAETEAEKTPPKNLGESNGSEN